MKFKFPKKIMIGDTLFHITYDKKTNGAEFQYPYKGEKAYINIGIRNIKVNPTRVLSMIIHELKEIIQIEQVVRFDRRDEHSDNTYEFHYSHKEHSDLCSRLGGLLDNFIQ